MATVTSLMTLGQLKRVCAISSDTVPQGEISKIMGDALVNGILKAELEIFWKGLVRKLSPGWFMKIMPSCDLEATKKLIDNIADFRDNEIYFPEGYVPEHLEMYAVPFFGPACIRDIANNVRNLGWQLGTPEDMLGLIKARRCEPVEDGFRLIAVGRKFEGGGYGSVMSMEASSGKLRLLRERINEDGAGGYFNGRYSILAVEKPTYG